MKRLALILAIAVLSPKWGFAADQITSQGIGPFAGLNTNQSPETISSSQSPDLLNVDISNGNTSVKKRQGYGLDATLTISTSAVHNLYKFFDANGNEVRLAFNDNRINSSINGAAWSVVITTGLTSGAIWDCTDYLGFAYCVSSAFDCPIKTNGVTSGTTGVCGTTGVPAGSLVSNSGDRLLVGATASNPSRLFYSQSAVFTNFALGIQPSDSSFEDIVAPGSKLTHLAYHFGRWLWWKDQSFGFIVGTGQFDIQIITVSNTIGTFDNTDVFDGNYVYFRGSDTQIYTYDGSVLSRAISTDIAPSLQAANRRKANQWTQTTQTDFQSGASSPTPTLSMTSSAGDVVSSSFNITENSSASWNNGTTSNTTVWTSSFSMSTNNSGNVTNNGFESALAGNWTVSGSGTGSFVQGTGYGSTCTMLPRSGSDFLDTRDSSFAGTWTLEITDLNGNVLSSKSITRTGNCAWNLNTLTDSADTGKRVKFRFKETSSGGTVFLTTSDSYIFGGSVIFYNAEPAGNFLEGFDDVTNGSSTITTGSFQSQVFNTGMPYSFVYASATWNVNTSTPSFVLQKSTATNCCFTDIASSTGTNLQTNKQYLRYLSTFTITSADNALSSITGVQLIARSSGTYFSAWNNAPSLTSWGTLGVTSTDGDGANNFYVRSSTSPQSVLNSTVAWIAQTKNGTVAASTGTYFQLIDSFTITSATGTATALNDFTFNWFEGSASDKMYGTYFKNAIWFSLSNGTTSTNNRIFRWDLLSNVWTLYDIAANGFLTYSNNLYFGDPSVGKVYQFGNNVYSDNGAAITAYWKSKPFFGDSPFTEKDLRMGSWYVASDSGTTLSVTYTLDESTNTVVKNISLSDSRKGMIRNNYNFPTGTAPTVFSAKVGDSSQNAPWEVFGGLVTFIPRPPNVTP